MNKRIKEIRHSNKLSQEEFGKAIGSARNTIANYENGNRNPSNSVIMSICREFNVNEDWLRTGTGEMFTGFDNQLMARIDYLMTGESTVAQRTFKALAQLSDEEWLTVEKLIDSIAAKK